jgi:hypothetical protein
LSEHFVKDELTKYLTTNKSLLIRIKTLKFHFILPIKDVKNLLDTLSRCIQQRKKLKYFRQTELVSEVAKVYLVKPQVFSINDY